MPRAGSRAGIAELLAFARCIRSQGFASFPDPTSSGGITHQMVAAVGINLHQPEVYQGSTLVVVRLGWARG